MKNILSLKKLFWFLELISKTAISKKSFYAIRIELESCHYVQFLRSINPFKHTQECPRNSPWPVRINQPLFRLSAIYIPFSHLSAPTAIMTRTHAELGNRGITYKLILLLLTHWTTEEPISTGTLGCQKYTPFLCNKKSLHSWMYIKSCHSFLQANL